MMRQVFTNPPLKNAGEAIDELCKDRPRLGRNPLVEMTTPRCGRTIRIADNGRACHEDRTRLFGTL